MITCEICGKVFREQDWKDFNLHNNVQHLHEYKGLSNYFPYTNGFGWVTQSTEDIKQRDELLARLNKY